MIRGVAACLLALAFLLGAPIVFPEPAHASVSYYRSITVDHTKVPNTDQSSFAVLVTGTYSYLATVANAGNVQNANGYDIGFYTNADCSTGKMNWETVKYIASTGEVEYWVNVSTLSHTTDTVFYLCYGNSGITTDQSSASSVWDANYVGVYHFGDGTTLSGTDSKGLNNGTFVGAPESDPGQVGGDADLDGDPQEMTAGSADLGATSLTVEGWVNADVYDVPLFGNGGAAGVVMFSTRTNDTDVSPTLGVSLQAGNHIVVWGADSAGLFKGAKGTTAMSVGTWYYVAGTWDGASWKAYTNGSLQGTNNFTVAGTFAGTFTGSPWLFAHSPQWSDAYSDEELDEMRISKSARTADWIKTEYNNESSPSTFYTVGSEQTITSDSSSAGRIIRLVGHIRLKGIRLR